MLTRRQFISILLMITALLILFQGPEIVKQRWNNYSQNESGREAEISGNETSPDGKETYVGSTIYVGDVKSKAYASCNEWAEYTKRQMKQYPSLTDKLVKQLVKEGEKDGDGSQEPDLICMDKTALKNKSSYQQVRQILKSGQNVVFVNLPDSDRVMKDKDLQSLLGIYYVQKTNVQSAGIHLYEGFLLGGERIYQAKNKEEEKKRQDMDLDVPWYVPTAGSRTFMSAIITDKQYNGLRNQDMPALIWRTEMEKATVYIVNGDYMDNRRVGIGILDGIVSDANEFTVYPVVNAQNLVLNGFPSLSDENEEKMREIYGYTQPELQKNILQPGIWALLRSEGIRPTAMILPKYDYGISSKVQDGALKFYLQQLREAKGEAGISFDYTGTDNQKEVLAFVNRTLASQADGYQFGAAYVPSKSLGAVKEMKKVSEGKTLTTILTDYSEGDTILSGVKDGCIRQPVLSDTATHTYSEDLELLGDESSLGYSNAQIDITSTLWPKNRDNEWENLSDNAFSNIASYWKYFSAFDKTTLSESGRKVRNFLNLQYESEFSKETEEGCILKLKASGSGKEADFLLRMHNAEVSDMSGGTFKKVENGVYLLKMTRDSAFVTIKKVEEQ